MNGKIKGKGVKYLKFLLISLAIVGIALVGLTFQTVLGSEDIAIRISLLTFLVGLVYLSFVFIMYETFLR